MHPNQAIISSGFASLANDSDSIPVTINIPAGVAVPLFPSTLTYSTTLAIGSIGAPMNYDINYSASTLRFKTNELQFVENASAANPYQGLVKAYRSSPTEISVYVVIGRGGSAVNTNARTVTVRVSTYLPPFS